MHRSIESFSSLTCSDAAIQAKSFPWVDCGILLGFFVENIEKRIPTITCSLSNEGSLYVMNDLMKKYSEGHEPLDARLSHAVGANVKRLRTQARIKKKTFALMVGIGRPFLDRIESGTADPRLSVIVRMADALETTPEQLMANPGDE